MQGSEPQTLPPKTASQGIPGPTCFGDGTHKGSQPAALQLKGLGFVKLGHHVAPNAKQLKGYRLWLMLSGSRAAGLGIMDGQTLGPKPHNRKTRNHDALNPKPPKPKNRNPKALKPATLSPKTLNPKNLKHLWLRRSLCSPSI